MRKIKPGDGEPRRVAGGVDEPDSLIGHPSRIRELLGSFEIPIVFAAIAGYRVRYADLLFHTGGDPTNPADVVVGEAARLVGIDVHVEAETGMRAVEIARAKRHEMQFAQVAGPIAGIGEDLGDRQLVL